MARDVKYTILLTKEEHLCMKESAKKLALPISQYLRLLHIKNAKDADATRK